MLSASDARKMTVTERLKSLKEMSDDVETVVDNILAQIENRIILKVKEGISVLEISTVNDIIANEQIGYDMRSFVRTRVSRELKRSGYILTEYYITWA